MLFMMNILVGLVLSVISGFMFAVSNMFVARGMTTHNISQSVFTTVLFSTLMIFISSVVTGEFFRIGALTAYSALLFSAAGALNFILGRMLNYTGMVILGPSRGSAITSSQSLFAVIFGVILIAEPLTLVAAGGVLLAFVGTVLVTIVNDKRDKLDSRGLIYALTAAIFVGLSVVVIRAANLITPLPVDGALISYLTATCFYFTVNIVRTRRLRSVVGGKIPLLAAAGTASGVAQSARFVALLVSPVVLVAPVVTANPLFTMLLSFITMRGRERLTLRLIVGAVMIISGVAVISYALGI